MNSAVERAISALWAIPADVSHDDWVKVLMGAKASDVPRDECERWSAQSDKFNAPDFNAAWNSIKQGGGIGPGTLFHIAGEEHGWTAQRSNVRLPMQKASPRPLKPPPRPRLNPEAAEVWERCEPATNAHPYIAAKRAAGVPLDNLRVVPAGDPLRITNESMAGALVVPCIASDGTLSTLQVIAPPDVAARLKAAGKPDKLNLPGHPVAGWFTVGEVMPGGIVYICEGVGQAWSCWQATGATAVACFGAGNMGKVAMALRQQDDAARLVLVPDVGKELEATKIATEVGGSVAQMPDYWEKNCDVNDLAQQEGMDVLALLLESANEPPKPPPLLKPVSVGDVLTNPSPPPAFIWDGYLPRGVVALLGAHGGTGKSTIALMLGVCAALGLPLFGIATVPCKVLFVSLEDGENIVRHRLAFICHAWKIAPAQLDGKLYIVDGTESPELFSADSRGAGETTATYVELRKLVQSEGVGLVVVDNASDAYGGDEIQRRQVRAFIRSLVEVARLTNCAVVLLAHVDKNTSKSRKAEGGEGYSGSTAWHNSARSRLFMTRTDMDTLTLEHQKSNLGRCHEPLALEWPDGGLPQLKGNDPADDPLNPYRQRSEGRAEDERAISVLQMIAEFEGRQQFCSTANTSRNHVHAVLKSEPAFQKLKLRPDDTKRIVNQCQRAKWIETLDYRTPDRKPRQRWTLTTEGRAIAGLTAPTAPCASTTEDGASLNMAQTSAPTAPTGIGGVGERVHSQDGATPCKVRESIT